MPFKPIDCLILTFVLAVSAACGRVERRPHYDEPKDYGRPPVNIAPVNDSGDAEIPGSTPAAVKVDPVNPDTVVASILFKGTVDPDSFRFITSSGDLLNPWSMPGSKYLRKYFEGNQSVLFYGRQTYGDEVTGVSKLFQDGISGTADLGVLVGGESESGTQRLERIVGNDEIDGACPTAAVCIRSMLWTPNTGKIRTFCYRDETTGEATIVPYAPAPNFPAKDAKKAAGSYGPYWVDTFDGEVNCAKLELEQTPTESHKIIIRFIFNPNPKMTYMVKKQELSDADYSVRVIVDKLGREPVMNEQPYVDAITRMQGESEYFMNSSEKTLLKVIKRTRKSINFPGDDTWIGSLIRTYNSLSPITGIMMDVHAEYCMNLMDDAFENFCSPTGLLP